MTELGWRRGGDALMDRVLGVRPADPQHSAGQGGQRAFGAALLISATRCTLQYIVLPFVLPLLGVLGRAPTALILPIDLIALLALVSSLRRFWRSRHPQRWRYLPIALVSALAIVTFLAYDLVGLR